MWLMWAAGAEKHKKFKELGNGYRICLKSSEFNVQWMNGFCADSQLFSALMHSLRNDIVNSFRLYNQKLFPASCKALNCGTE